MIRYAVCRHVARIDQSLHEAVIARDGAERPTPKVQDARIAKVTPYRSTARWIDEQRRDGRAHRRERSFPFLPRLNARFRSAKGAFEQLAGYALGPGNLIKNGIDNETGCDATPEVTSRTVRDYIAATATYGRFTKSIFVRFASSD
jgi:hypothetical protein